ncbi:YheU family protein [Marinomonas mediterranea]|jgi:Uncharacterized protein conserved in bacteria|uniref:Uncharacterized protein n=1 Tax=Marinomonas mediterranea (strain ATCC 700492 / JCM 21426 / NBRC 103028 / MMB-1) TaxID=717774 RepID=F2K322_MARM1|nr:YheU family protein [Marinomonas mediterranea]ADZ92411.1 protein of unknown function UPF0270 [Marinomonas mediterranea MMB-1]WCN10362.1 YheU family protein [Marinomonas mediterranea]WCN14408.1 YheU family protein [Marinomonas mediterranea]WCN18460.1 YheU family protein [Marinomonas mediterranea MMB-1]
MDTIVPWESLEVDTLNNVLKDIVTRDGTDYGDYELSAEQKIAQAKHSLQSGEAVLLFDTESETIKMVLKDQLSYFDY